MILLATSIIFTFGVFFSFPNLVLSLSHGGSRPGPEPSPSIPPGPSPSPGPPPPSPIPAPEIPLPPGRIIRGAFGGKIQSVKECTCSPRGTRFIKVGSPVPGDFIITNEIIVLGSGIVERGRWTLGIAQRRFNVCLVATLLGCFPEGAGQAIKIIGTN